MAGFMLHCFLSGLTWCTAVFPKLWSGFTSGLWNWIWQADCYKEYILSSVECEAEPQMCVYSWVGSHTSVLFQRQNRRKTQSNCQGWSPFLQVGKGNVFIPAESENEPHMHIYLLISKYALAPIKVQVKENTRPPGCPDQQMLQKVPINRVKLRFDRLMKLNFLI